MSVSSHKTMDASANVSTQLEGINASAHEEPMATILSEMAASSLHLQVSTIHLLQLQFMEPLVD